MEEQIIPDLFVVYLKTTGFSPMKTNQLVYEMFKNIERSIKKPGERWMVLPSDRDEVSCVNIGTLSEEKAEEFMISFEKTRDIIMNNIKNIQ